MSGVRGSHRAGVTGLAALANQMQPVIAMWIKLDLPQRGTDQLANAQAPATSEI
jgi:hypothetical protein